MKKCPEVLGIDEHFFSRKKGYATTLVDLQHHKVLLSLMCRHHWNLSSVQKERLHQYLAQAPCCRRCILPNSN